MMLIPALSEDLVHRLGPFDRFRLRKRRIGPGPVGVIERGIAEHDRRIQARELRRDFDRFLCRENIFLQGVAGQTDHQLDAEGKAIVLDQRSALIDDIGLMPATGKAQDLLVERLYSELDDIDAVSLEVV